MKYSFVLLSYNQEDFIAEAVAAALAQEGPALEIILSDDCSTDRTFDIMQALATAYHGPHQVILNRNAENIGIVAHIRKASDLSSGEIIIAASGDDVSLPDRAAKIIAVFEATDAWLVHSHAVCIDLQGNEVPSTYATADLIQGAKLEKIAISQALYLGASAAIHRKILRKYGHINNPLAYEDLIFGFRASLEGGVQFIDQPLVRYRVGSGISTKFVQTDVGSLLRERMRMLKVSLAVLAQRRRDAVFFGLLPADKVLRAIKKQRRVLIVELHYWRKGNASKYRRWAWFHPFDSIAVRRSIRRFKRRMARLSK